MIKISFCDVNTTDVHSRQGTVFCVKCYYVSVMMWPPTPNGC